MCHGRMVRFQRWSVCTPCGASPVLHAASVACVMEFSLVNRLLASLSALCCILFCSRNRWNDKELDNVSLHGVYVLWAVLRPNSMQIAVRKFQRLIFGCAQAGDCNLGGSMMLEAKRDLLKRNCISWQREGVGYHQTQCAWPLCIRFGLVRGKVWYCLKSIMTHDCFFIRESPCRCGQSWPIPNTLLWLVEDELSGVELSTGASCALPDFLDICLP